jgi:two-component system invasion response regulator UvrY
MIICVKTSASQNHQGHRNVIIKILGFPYKSHYNPHSDSSTGLLALWAPVAGSACPGFFPISLRFGSPGQSPNMIKILVVDDHAVVRAGVHYFIDNVPDMEIAGEAGTAEEAIRLIRAQDWDIVLLDIAMPDKSGVEVLKQIKREKPDLPVLILSMHPENRYAVQILRSGASGYVQKEALATELLNAIQTILRGHKYISYAVAELLTMDPDINAEKPLHETLSSREYEIFYKLSQGEGVTKIADELCLSVKTVSTYRARVLQKMNMTSNADIIYYAIKQNLID